MANILDLKKLKKEIRYDGMQQSRDLATKQNTAPSVSERLAKPFAIDTEETEKTLVEQPHPKVAADKAPMQDTPLSHHVYIEWEAHEYPHIPKRTGWFVTLWSITLALAAAGIYFANYLFSVFVVIAGALVTWFGIREPKLMNFKVTSEGIQLGDRIYLFEDLRSFWIFYDPPLFKELSIESKKPFMPYLRAPLGDTDRDALRETLRKFLPEEKQKESFISILSHLLRF